jgi:hypothetical protein
VRWSTTLRHLGAIQDHLEYAAILHRLEGVRAEIHRDLMKLGRIADDRRVAGLKTPFETYAGRK